jgi:hypothetical protein
MAYRTADGSGPNTITMLEFRTVEEARQGATSNEIKPVLDGLRSVGAAPKVLVVERSPFTPAPEGGVPRLVRGWLPENDADRVQPANSRIFLNGIVLVGHIQGPAYTLSGVPRALYLGDWAPDGEEHGRGG